MKNMSGFGVDYIIGIGYLAGMARGGDYAASVVEVGGSSQSRVGLWGESS